MYGRGKEQSDIEYNIEVHCGKKFLNRIEPAYVDSNNTMTLKRKKNKKYIAIFNGCLNTKKRKRRRKEIPIDCRDYIVQRCLDLGFIPVILGSRSDYKNFWRHNDIIDGKSVVNYLGKLSLKKTVSILNQCDNFISNDTGLYHVAGALKKKGLVLWRGTDFYKNATTFKGIKRVENRKCVKKIYNKRVNKYLEKLL
jgi:ADP-heptose:LPS heptosyltransferase